MGEKIKIFDFTIKIESEYSYNDPSIIIHNMENESMSRIVCKQYKNSSAKEVVMLF